MLQIIKITKKSLVKPVLQVHHSGRGYETPPPGSHEKNNSPRSKIGLRIKSSNESNSTPVSHFPQSRHLRGRSDKMPSRSELIQCTISMPAMANSRFRSTSTSDICPQHTVNQSQPPQPINDDGCALLSS